MSSIFSDPFFRRGSTLLGGETIEVDGSGNPVAGGEIVGQVKVFQDCNPVGLGERYSNRLVYCVAARYKGATTNDAATALAGKVVAFSATAPLTEFSAAAEDGDPEYGVVDEYLTGTVRQNDIVWVVVKGPTKANVTGSITAGDALEIGTTGAGSEGTLAARSSGELAGTQIAGATASGLVRVNLHSHSV